MASAQNKIEVDNFEGFQFLVFNEDDYLYIRIQNNESLSLYEKMIEETDLTDYGNIFDLNELYLFFSNVFNHENESQYQMIIETSTDFLEICLKKKVGDQFLVQTRIHIPKIFSESEKQKELLSEIDNRHRDEVSSVTSMKQLEIDSLEERIRNIQEEHQREITSLQGIIRNMEDEKFTLENELSFYRIQVHDAFIFVGCVKVRDSGHYYQELPVFIPKGVKHLKIKIQYNHLVNGQERMSPNENDISQYMRDVRNSVGVEKICVVVFNCSFNHFPFQKMPFLKTLEVTFPGVCSSETYVRTQLSKMTDYFTSKNITVRF
jgi:hypothetical protein